MLDDAGAGGGDEDRGQADEGRVVTHEDLRVCVYIYIYICVVDSSPAHVRVKMLHTVSMVKLDFDHHRSSLCV